MGGLLAPNEPASKGTPIRRHEALCLILKRDWRGASEGCYTGPMRTRRWFTFLSLSVWASLAVAQPEPGGADLSTPKHALRTFILAAREGDYGRAARVLDLSGVPTDERAAEGPTLARELKSVLDQELWIDFSRVPDDPESDRVTVGTIGVDGRHVPVELVGSGGVWHIGRRTVDAIPALYAAHGPSWIESMLPRWLSKRVWEMALWQWLGLLGTLIPRLCVGGADRRVRHAARGPLRHPHRDPLGRPLTRALARSDPLPGGHPPGLGADPRAPLGGAGAGGGGQDPPHRADRRAGVVREPAGPPRRGPHRGARARAGGARGAGRHRAPGTAHPGRGAAARGVDRGRRRRGLDDARAVRRRADRGHVAPRVGGDRRRRPRTGRAALHRDAAGRLAALGHPADPHRRHGDRGGRVGDHRGDQPHLRGGEGVGSAPAGGPDEPLPRAAVPELDQGLARAAGDHLLLRRLSAADGRGARRARSDPRRKPEVGRAREERLGDGRDRSQHPGARADLAPRTRATSGTCAARCARS